jgi:transcriptional regulator with XRE-family HTH domain
MTNWYEDPTVLRDRRTRLKITQAQLAKAAGLSQAYISEIEKGTRPFSYELAERLWNALMEIKAKRKGDAKTASTNSESSLPVPGTLQWLMSSSSQKIRSLEALGLDKTPEERLREENVALKAKIAALEEQAKTKDALSRIKDRLIEVQKNQIRICDELIDLSTKFTGEQAAENTLLAERNAEYSELLGLESKVAIAVQERDEAREKVEAALVNRESGDLEKKP